MENPKLLKKLLKFLFIITVLCLSSIFSPAHAENISFNYADDIKGTYISDGVANDNTYNYNYGNVAGVPFDNEGYVNYGDKAYVKKSVTANPNKQGLFDVTLDVKGNHIDPPKNIDIVFVIDFSSTMKGEKLENTFKALEEFGSELKQSLTNGNIRIGIVAYNRFVYTTPGLTGSIPELEDFMINTAEAHSGTFTQKGLLAAKKLLDENGRSDSDKMLIHIGDGSANRSYIPVDGTTLYTNSGEITGYNGYQNSTYYKEFQTESDAYQTTSNPPNDTNGVTVPNDKIDGEINGATLGSAVEIKESGIECYSIGVAPSSRGEYITRNLATDNDHYLSIDENLAGLGEALDNITTGIDRTISKGVITDPMGNGILLQGSGDFTSNNYTLRGWRKDAAGKWNEADDLIRKTSVSEQNQIINVSDITLGADERLTLTYHVRIDTESTEFKGETWYLCNGKDTTLDPDGTGQTLLFPVPSIKAPKVTITVEKEWVNVAENLIPDSIDFVVSRKSVVSDSWISSDRITLTKEEGYKKQYDQVAVTGNLVDLPVYNNDGEDFLYDVAEIDVPNFFESSVRKSGNEFTIVNVGKTPNPSTGGSTTESKTSSVPTSSVPSLESREVSSNSQKKDQSLIGERNNDTPNYHLPNTGDRANYFILTGTSVILLSSILYFLKFRK